MNHSRISALSLDKLGNLANQKDIMGDLAHAILDVNHRVHQLEAAQHPAPPAPAAEASAAQPDDAGAIEAAGCSGPDEALEAARRVKADHLSQLARETSITKMEREMLTAYHAAMCERQPAQQWVNNAAEDQRTIERLTRERDEANRRAEKEKATRIKYQDCAYAACDFLDGILGRRMTNGTGTTIDKFREAIDEARAKLSRPAPASEPPELSIMEISEIHRKHSGTVLREFRTATDAEAQAVRDICNAYIRAAFAKLPKAEPFDVEGWLDKHWPLTGRPGIDEDIPIEVRRAVREFAKAAGVAVTP